MNDWDEVVAFATALPDVTMAPYYGVPVPKVNGRAIASPGREEGSFHLPVGHDAKAMLMASDPDTFWETEHYRGWPGVLVRYGRERDRVALYLRRSWWDHASARQRKAAGERP